MERQLEAIAGTAVSTEQLQLLKSGWEAKFEKEKRGLNEVSGRQHRMSSRRRFRFLISYDRSFPPSLLL